MPLPLGRLLGLSDEFARSTIKSADAFGLSVIGYVGEPGDKFGSAYAYPGGMALNSLNVP